MKRLVLVVFGSLILLAALFFGLAGPQNEAFALETGRDAATLAVVAAQTAPGLLLTVTLNTDPECPEARSAIEVRLNTTVHYCYTIENTGDVTFTSHAIAESAWGPIDPFTRVVSPGHTYLHSTEREITQSTTSQATWQAFDEAGAPSALATTFSTVTVVTPSLTVSLTVGRAEDGCADTDTTTVPSGATAYFCLEVENTSDITLTRPTFVAPALINGNNGELPLAEFILPPGDRQVITGGTLRAIGVAPFLELTSVTEDMTVAVTVTWETSTGVSNSASDTAIVEVDNATIDVRKTLSVEPGACTGNRVLTVAPNQDMYYCLVVRNTGELILTEHTFAEPSSGVRGAFQYNLAPGSSLTLTQATITSTPNIVFSEPPRLGPFQQTVTETRILTFTSTNAEGFSATDTTSTTLNVSLAPLAVVLSGWTAPNPCILPPNPIQTYNIGGRIWYCVQIRNNSSVALTNHRMTHTILPPNQTNVQYAYSVTREFTHTLQPGATIVITNSFFTSTLQQPPFMGPFTITAPIITTNKLTNTVYLTSTNPAVGFRIANRASFSVFVNPATATPSPTFTVSPQPTNTPTPEPTFTPLGGIPTSTPTPTPTAIALSLPPTPTPTTDFSVRNNVSTPASQFISPLGPPTPTPMPTVDSPLPTPTFTTDPTVLAAALAAEAAATETVLALSFTPTATATDTPLPTSTDTGTATPMDTVTATATQRPIEQPRPDGSRGGDPMATPDSLSLFSQIVDASLAAAGWIWFAVGSLVFFTAAGIVAGLSFRQQEQRRYRLYGDPPGNSTSHRPPATTRQSSTPVSEDDDHWPASLP